MMRPILCSAAVLAMTVPALAQTVWHTQTDFDRAVEICSRHEITGAVIFGTGEMTPQSGWEACKKVWVGLEEHQARKQREWAAQSERDRQWLNEFAATLPEPTAAGR